MVHEIIWLELTAREQLTGIVHYLSVDDNHTPADGTKGFESLSSHDKQKWNKCCFFWPNFVLGTHCIMS